MKKTGNNLYHLEIFIRNRENRGGCVVNLGETSAVVIPCLTIYEKLIVFLHGWNGHASGLMFSPKTLIKANWPVLSKNRVRLSRFILYLWKRISFSLNSKNSLRTMNSFSLFPTISIRRMRAWRCHVIESLLVTGPLNSVLLFEKE